MELAENLNISVKEYLNNERHDIKAIIDNSEFKDAKRDKYNIGEFKQWTCGDVKECIDMYGRGILVDLISIGKVYLSLAGINVEEILNEPVFDAHMFCNFLIDQIEKVVLLEKNTLSSEPKDYEIACGIDMFKELGYHSQILYLAGDDITKYEEVRKQPYWLFHLAMRKSVLNNIYQENVRLWHKPKNTN